MTARRRAARAAAAGLVAAGAVALADEAARHRAVRAGVLLAAVMLAAPRIVTPKLGNLENRFVAMYGVTVPAATSANTNASDAISRLNTINSISPVGATGGPYSTFGGATDGTTLKSNINATIADLNDLAGDVANLAARLNQIYTDAG